MHVSSFGGVLTQEVPREPLGSINAETPKSLGRPSFSVENWIMDDGLSRCSQSFIMWLAHSEQLSKEVCRAPFGVLPAGDSSRLSGHKAPN